MRYVYLLCDHGESGSENVVATLDRSVLTALFVRHFTALYGDTPHVDEWLGAGLRSLETLLAKPDETLARTEAYALHDAWGGALFYVLPLEGPPR